MGFPLPGAVVTIDAVDVAPVEVGVTEFGLSEQDEPAGVPVQARATAVVKPFNPVTVTVEVPVAPAATLTEAGEAAMLKSGLVVPPVPASAAVCGLLASLSATLSVAVTEPLAVGVNVTLIVQLVLFFPLLRWSVTRLGPLAALIVGAAISVCCYLQTFRIIDMVRALLFDSAHVGGFFIFYYAWIFAPTRFVNVVAGIVLARPVRCVCKPATRTGKRKPR